MRTLLFALLSLGACAPQGAGRPDCDALVPDLCALPWPSSRFLVEADSPTGYRVAFGATSLPESRDDVQTGSRFLDEKDGFSISGAMIAWFDDLSDEGLIPHTALERYADADARTVVIDVDTGERVPHFAEIDRTGDDDAERVLFLRPVQPLRWGARYVVGVRGLVTKAGAPVELSPGFEALRDGKRSGDAGVEARRDHFDDVVFPALEAQGFERDDLQLAWDYVTASQENTQGRLLHMLDDAFSDLGDGPAYIVNVTDHDCSQGNIARDLRGRFTAPLYTEEDAADTLLTRDDDGLPFRTGTTEVDFRVRVPCSVFEDPHAAPVLQYGHGFFGDLGEAGTGWLAEFAHRNGYVIVAAEWTGMAGGDIGAILQMILWDPTRFPILPERGQQGLLENVLLGELATGPLVADPALVVDGVPLLDPERLVYYGNSQGGIFGGALVAISPRIERGVLGVGGAPYNLMLERSNDFTDFFRILQEKYSDHRDIMVLLAAFQTLWDPSESSGWGMNIPSPLPGRPAKAVLIQTALGDAQVNDLSSAYLARMTGASLVEPSTRPVFGVEASAPGFTGSAFVEYAYADTPAVPVANLPPDKAFDTHECPRRDPDAQRQAVAFLNTGVVEHTCDGPCTGRPSDFCR